MPFERDAYVFGEISEGDPGRNKADGNKRMLRLASDGSLITKDWPLALLGEGKLFNVNAGLISAVVASAGAVTATVPDVHIQIPSGTKIIPLFISLTVDALVDDQDVEILALISNGVDSSPTGGSLLAIYNCKNSLAGGSKCIANSDVSGITSPITDRRPIEFWRDGSTVGGSPTAAASEVGPRNTYNYDYRDRGPVEATGDSELCLYLGKAATNYQATIVFAEFDA